MKICKRCMPMLLILLCLTGCGQKETIIEEDGTEISADWRANGFTVSGEVQEEQALWTLEHTKWQHEDVRYDASTESVDVLEPGSCGGQFYRLYNISQLGQEVSQERYLLEIYDPSTMQTDVTEIVSEKLEIDNGYISGMGIIGQGEYVFRVLEYGRDQANKLTLMNHYLVYSDLADNTERVDVTSVLQEEGITENTYTNECICDSDGNIYSRAGSDEHPFQSLYILDREGHLLMKQEGDRNDEIRNPLRMPQGELVFPIYNIKDKTTRLVWFDVEKKEAITLASFNQDTILQMYGIQGNDIYYESFYGIVKWNIVSGDRKLIYRFDENGIPKVYSTMLMLRKEGQPILRMYGTISDEEEDWLVSMSEQETEPPEEIRIVSLSGNSSAVQNCAAVAFRRNPGYYFSYEVSAEKDADDFRTRIIAEMVAGGGPDILYVSLEDMKLLQSRGLLKELDDLLPEKSMEQILPGVIELGTVDGAFVGLAPEMNIYTAITLKSIWNQDTWCLEDVLSLMDTGNYTGIFCQGTTSFAPRALLSLMTEAGLQDSSLIDWETRESHFDSELFLRIMETAKTYGDNPVKTDTWLGEGGCVGQMLGDVSISTFDMLYEKYGEDFHFVGELTKGTSGSYVASDGVLVVNGNVSDSTAVAAYLECLLRDEIQYSSLSYFGIPILKVSPEDVQMQEFSNEEVSIKVFTWKNNRINVREDGTSVLNEYKSFLESCVPYPDSYNNIVSIVWEEAQGYIEGDKNAKDVAQIIDRRVQVYLDERN